jgi:hypothetical protein
MNGIRRPDKRASLSGGPESLKTSDEENVPYLFLVRNMFFFKNRYWPVLSLDGLL